MSSSLVSIVIPTYKPTFLGQAIESALAQTYRSIEIVVSDNCPGEEVHELVMRFPRVRYVRNRIPGIYSNFRNCIRLAGGEYVKFLLDDDLLSSRCVEVLLQGFNEYPDATLVSSWYQVIDAEGRERQLRRLVERKLVSSPGGAASHMLVSARNPIGPLTTSMFRRRSLPLGLGPWFFHTGAPQTYFGLIDMTIILDLAFLGRTIVFPEPLSAMRVHPEQLSNSALNPGGIRSLTSWYPLAVDAHAFGLISDQQFASALTSIAGLYRRFLRPYPLLVDHLSALEARLVGMGAQEKVGSEAGGNDSTT